MHRRIDTTLWRLRQDLSRHLDKSAIDQACRQADHVWRDGRLTPFATIHWFLIQILLGNTALQHISLLACRSFTAAAYCCARARLPLAVLCTVLRNVIQALIPQTETEARWRGHRTFLVDGSSFSMPDTPELQQHFGQPGGQTPGCGFPVAKILAMFHAGTGLLLDVTAAPLRSHEMARIDGVHPTLMPDDVLVGDRGFCSFAHLALLARRGVHAVFRIHQKQIVDFTPGRPDSRSGGQGSSKGLPRSRWLFSLGAFDQVVEWFKPRDRPDWMAAEDYAALPETLTVRELRYQVSHPGFRTRSVTLVTTLLDGELYPTEALAELYWSRWRVEMPHPDYPSSDSVYRASRAA